MSQRTCSVGFWLRSQTVSTGAGIMASTTIFLGRVKLYRSYFVRCECGTMGGTSEDEPAAKIIEEGADRCYPHHRHVGPQYEGYTRRIQDNTGCEQPVRPDRPRHGDQVRAYQQAQHDMHEVFAPRQAALVAAARCLFEHVRPCHDDVGCIHNTQNRERQTVKPEVRDHDKLRRIYRMPDGVPENLSLALWPRAQVALVVMKIDNIKYSEVARDQ